MIGYVVAGFLVLHGLINAIGLPATWRLGKFAIASTPQFGPTLSAGSAPVMVLGMLWLVAALGFVAGAIGLVTATAWWKIVVGSAALISLLLCVAWWNDAKVGAVIDFVILLALVATAMVVRPPAAA